MLDAPHLNSESLGTRDHVDIMQIECKNRRTGCRTHPKQYMIGGNTRKDGSDGHGYAWQAVDQGRQQTV